MNSEGENDRKVFGPFEWVLAALVVAAVFFAVLRHIGFNSPFQPLDTLIGYAEWWMAILAVALFVGWLAFRLDIRRAWPEALFVLFVPMLLASLLANSGQWLGWTKSRSQDPKILMQLKAEHLVNGAVAMRPNDYITLSIKGADGTKQFSDIRVVALYAADGTNTSYTSKQPHSYLIEVPSDRFDDLANAMQNKKQAYIQLQGGTATPTATATQATASPAIIATATPIRAEIALPRERLQLPRVTLKSGSPVLVIIVQSMEATNGITQTGTAVPFDAVILDELASAMTPTADPWVSVVRGGDNAEIVDFARMLTEADAIYVLDIPPTPTPTPDSTP